MSNSINSLSPSFRDFLLLKNLVTDTVVDNSLQSLLSGIGFPAQTETPPISVQPSNSINNTYQFYQQSNTILNEYQGSQDDYTLVNIVTNIPITDIQGPYTNNNNLLGSSEDYRDDNTIKNIYVDKDKQSTINLNTQPVPIFQNLTSYIDENNNLLVGGPGTQAANILTNFANGNLLANADIRATLLGRVLGATGVINDTPLGNIGSQQLLSHVGYNAAFGLQQETLGRLNLNPLSIIQGNPLTTLNYSITVPKNNVGKVVNFAANIFGVQSPISLLQSSVFSFDNKGTFIGNENISMGNEMIKNSGKGQVKSLFDNLRANTRIDNLNNRNLRQGYAPGYTDDRKAGGQNVGDGLNPKLYIRDDGTGKILDFINGETNSPISSTNYELSKQINDDGWDVDYTNNIHRTRKGINYKDAFGWQNVKINKDSNEKIGDATLFTSPKEKDKKTLLYKTQKLFDSGNMRTIVSGHGDINNVKSQINSAVSSNGGYTSKGSGVMSRVAIVGDGNGGQVNEGPENVFCRTWTTYDRYSQVIDLQKNSGLYGTDPMKKVFRRNTEFSVLEDNGFARIAPYKTDKMSGIIDGEKGKSYSKETDNKRYMFSIENLAWSDDLSNLLPCEVGPGDLLSGKRGRIMWFPPYEISFNETTSASWDKHNFIGRGEPMYTYNNTERTGTLSWKIIIDHPNYLNFMSTSNGITSSNYDEFVASFFAGCIPYNEINNFLTPEEQRQTELANNIKQETEVLPDNDVLPDSFRVYFPNDVYDVDKYPNYEDGKCNSNLIKTLAGHSNIVLSANFSPDGTKIVTASGDKTAKIWNTSNGNLIKTLAGHSNYVLSANFSPDGTKVVTASWDDTAKIWNTSNGNLIKTLVGHSDNVNVANFSPDGTKVVTASGDKTAKIWDTSNGNLIKTLAGHSKGVSSANFSPDGTKIVTTSGDKTAKIWNTSNGNLLFTLAGHSDIVLSANFSPDGTKVVTASYDKTAKIWDTSNGNLFTTLVGHSDYVLSANFSPDGTKVVTASWDNTAKIWDSTKADCTIDYTTNPNGDGFGIGDYTEMCYQFKSGGKTQWSSVKCSNNKPPGPEGGKGRLEPDRTDFGLNAKGSPNTEPYKGVKLGDKTYNSWRDPEYHKDLQQWMLTKCKSCKVKVTGYASAVGTFGDNRNDELSRLRAENVKSWISNNILEESLFGDRIVVEPSGLGSQVNSGCKQLKDAIPNYDKKRNSDYTISVNDTYPCKSERYVTVEFFVDGNLKADEKPKNENELDRTRTNILPKISPNRFYSECDYFEKLSQTSPIAYDTIKEKIKYFQPAFHSTTPEGFNSRLTFLQQCMRQGPTQGAGKTDNPNNLAFGAPPVCILRIGDFYHTKIIIETLSFAFEPLVWDLNPEGVGVQPMICTVDMTFNFIGGSSLQGPINKLQNAVSFNYYANTEIYDLRADTIKVKDGKGEIIPGELEIIKTYNVTDAETQGKGVEYEKNQEAQNNNINSGDQTLTEVGSTGAITDIDIFTKAMGDTKLYDLNIKLKNDKVTGTFTIYSGLLSKPYDVKLKLVDENNTKLDIAAFKISAVLASFETSFGGFSSNGWELIFNEISKNGTKPLKFAIEVPELKQVKFYIDKTLNDLK